MLSLIFLLSIQTVAPAPAASAPTGRSLKDLPGVTIKYYDVTGKNMKSVIKSIDKQRKDSATGQTRTVSHNWSLDAGFRKRTVNGVCTITGVEAPFTASAELPRLVNPRLSPADAAEWQKFSTKIESDAAAKLWFAYDRSRGLEPLIIGKDCEKGVAEGTAFIARLKADAAAFQPPAEIMPPAAKASAAGPATSRSAPSAPSAPAAPSNSGY